jgi:acetoin utilization deacetylase AcuC-like enzyme
MKIIFNTQFYQSDYADNPASAPKRLEGIADALVQAGYEFSQAAQESQILAGHDEQYFNSVKKDKKLFQMAMLAAGAAIKAGQTALVNQPCFACIRPPGHHASKNSAWGYCVFSNLALALLNLKKKNFIKSAFILDFDAHTGDGTIDMLSHIKDFQIFNPMAETGEKILMAIQKKLDQIKYTDIIAISAGFDNYIKDLGKKMSTSDFYILGKMVKKFNEKMCHNRRFAVLEGGYYHEDLGKNVLAFCNGFS